MTLKRPASLLRSALLIVVLALSVGLWFKGLLQSPLFHPELPEEQAYVRRYLEHHAPHRQEERALAEAYWARYPDVGSHPYYGRNGTLGVAGAAKHFSSYGKREGRILARLPEADPTEHEQALAEAYWQRYPDVEQSPVWGRQGTLGLLGPRDHYRHRGKKQGRVWGLESAPIQRPL